MGETKSCLVLMSTYNGEKYLKEQIESVLNQLNVDITLWVADDCSTDRTVDILKDYKTKFDNFNYFINEHNKNFTYNFIDLLFKAQNQQFDYYAFCDQDDIWLPDKIYSAISKIEECIPDNQNGIMYCSNQTLVDAQLNFIRMKFEKSPFFKNRYVHIFENIATGCTIVFDKAFKDYACKYYPKNIYLHDHYLFLLAMFTATCVYDEKSYIMYRQHENNLIGVKKLSFSQRLSRFLNKKTSQSALPREIVAGYEKYLTADDLKHFKTVADYNISFAKKLKLLFSFNIYPKSHYLNYKIKILLGKL